MKRILVTLCTLSLSLLGTYGVNQLSQSNDNNVNNNIETVAQMDEKAAESEELQADKDKSVADNETIVEETSKNQVTPEETKEADAKTKDETTNEVASKKVSKNIASNKNVKEYESKKVENIEAKTSTKASVPQETKNSNNKEGKTLVYKNVDLSSCNSVAEVVSKLQSNGFKDININNIDDIESLENIIANIQNKTGDTQKNNTGNNNTASKEETKKPTTPSPTQKPSTSTDNTNDSGLSNYASEVLRLVNIERSKAGLSALTTNSTLTAAADKRAQETKQSFSHTRPNGSSFSTVLKEFNISYRTAGENIAYGQRTPQEVVTGWMNSPGHRANILNANFGKIGIGVYQASNGTIYWTQLFTN